MAKASLSFPGLPNQLIQNPLWRSISPFIQDWNLLCPLTSEHFIAVRAQLQLPDQPAYDLAVKYWPEQRTKDFHTQVAAAGRATNLLDHELLLPELFSCRVKGQGIVSISQYGGKDLEDLLSEESELWEKLQTIEKQEEFLKQLVAHLLLALEYMHLKPEHDGGAQCYRDLKPSNIVIDLETMKARLIDFGFMMRQDCSDFFGGISTDHVPVDYTAIDPETDAPYCCDDKRGYEKASLKVAASNAGSIDSNMVGITALRVLSFFTDIKLLPVEFEDAKYKVTPAEKEGLDQEQRDHLQQSKTTAFAADYREYMSDQPALSKLLSSTGISAEAVKFLLALLEVDPSKRPSIRRARSMPWVSKSVKQIRRQITNNKTSYQAERKQYEHLLSGLQQAAEELSHHQQQQQLEERQQLSATRKALELAQQENATKEQQVEQLEHEVLMLQAQLKAASAAASAQLQAAEEQLAEMMQANNEQMDLIELLEQQLLSQQQQLEEVPAGVAHHMAAEEEQQQQQQSNKEEECDGLQQQLAHVDVQQDQTAAAETAAALSCGAAVAVLTQHHPAVTLDKVHTAEVGEETTDSRSTNSSLGGTSSSDLSVPHTPICSSGGDGPNSSSLTAAALRPSIEISSQAVSCNASHKRTAGAATVDILNSSIASDDAVSMLGQPQTAVATAFAAVTDSRAINKVIDIGSISGSNSGSSSDLSAPDTAMCNSGGNDPSSSSLATAALPPSMEISNQAMTSSGDAVDKRTAVEATQDMTNSNTASDNAASALGQHKAATAFASSRALSHSLLVGDTAVREYRSTNNSLMHMFGVYLVDVGSWGDVTDGLISDAMLCYRWMRMTVAALTSFCF